MAIGLREGISFCDVGGRLIFLDIDADSYFALGTSAEAAFRRVVSGMPILDEDIAAQRLFEAGLLNGNAPLAPVPCQAPPLPVRSLVETPAPGVGPASVLLACRALVLTRIKLKRAGLATTLNSFVHEAEPRDEPERGNLRVWQIATAFARSARLVRSHDRCLERAIAIRASLARLDIESRIVIGVRLRPFAAHAWVQRDECLISDRIDQVSSYTPILVR